MSLVASGKLAPIDWVETLVSLDAKQLKGDPFGPLLLLIRAPEEDDSAEFIRVLESCVKKKAAVTGEFQKWAATSQFPTMQVNDIEVAEADQIELISELASAPHCIVPLLASKPKQQFSLGRSTESAIRLADPSVSSEHALIHLEDSGARVSDVGSKNGTNLNGRRLGEGDAPWLQPMDRLTFGRVQAFACAPRVLRGVLRQDLRALV